MKRWFGIFYESEVAKNSRGSEGSVFDDKKTETKFFQKGLFDKETVVNHGLANLNQRDYQCVAFGGDLSEEVARMLGKSVDSLSNDERKLINTIRLESSLDSRKRLSLLEGDCYDSSTTLAYFYAKKVDDDLFVLPNPSVLVD